MSKEESKQQEPRQEVYYLEQTGEIDRAAIIAKAQEQKRQNNQELEEISNKISVLIQEGEEQISRKYQKGIFVIGNTGAGKSTLVNYLADSELVYRKKYYENSAESEWKIDVLNPSSELEKIKISDKMQSETTIPNYWFDSKKNLVF
jgi:predicted ATPase